MFWLAGKGIVSPQTLQTHFNVELVKSGLYFRVYTMEYSEQKHFTASNSPYAHTLALNTLTILKKIIFSMKKHFLLKTVI